mgnify:CR=1 FL=1
MIDSMSAPKAVVLLQARIPPELHARLKALSEQQGLSMNALVIRVIEDGLRPSSAECEKGGQPKAAR